MLVSINSGSAWVRNVICATVGKRVGCGNLVWCKYGGYRQVQARVGLQNKTRAGL